MDYGISQRKLKAGPCPYPDPQHNAARLSHAAPPAGPPGAPEVISSRLLPPGGPAGSLHPLSNGQQEVRWHLFGAQAQTSMRCSEKGEETK